MKTALAIAFGIFCLVLAVLMGPLMNPTCTTSSASYWGSAVLGGLGAAVIIINIITRRG